MNINSLNNSALTSFDHKSLTAFHESAVAALSSGSPQHLALARSDCSSMIGAVKSSIAALRVSRRTAESSNEPAAVTTGLDDLIASQLVLESGLAEIAVELGLGDN